MSAMFVTVPCPSCGARNRADLDRLSQRPRCGSCRTPLELNRPIVVDTVAFDEILAGSEAPVLVDFHADWCGPCRIVGPVVEELARARAGAVLVLKVDTDRNPELSERLGIRGIPTLIAFRNGRETGRHVGIATRPHLDALVNRA
jgi:thioredoxin 2